MRTQADRSGNTACIAPDYIVVPREKQDALLTAIKKQHDAVFPHASLEQDDYPRIISDGHFDRLHESLQKSQGTTVLIGESNKAKRMMGITVVKDVTWDDELMKGYVLACARTNEGADCVSMNRELFGPILPIVPVDSISTAIDRLKGTTPLAVYIFSQSNKFIDWVRRSTTSGSVLVNDLMVQFTIDGLPFGGVGESGQGNYHGKRSFDVFTHERSSLSSPYWSVRILPFCLRELTLLSVQGGSSARSTILPIHGRKYQIDEVFDGQEDQVCSSRNQCWPDWSRRPDPKGLPAQLAGTSYRYAVEELELACSADSEVQDHTDSLDIAMV